jgi:hypothetical protein
MFDVFVVGAADSTPAGISALANSLVEPLRMPVAVITKGLQDRKLCAGRELSQQDAQALVRQLRPLGAMTVIRPSGPADRTAQRAAPPPPPTAATLPPPVASPGPPVTDPFAPPPSGVHELSLASSEAAGGGNHFIPPPSSPDLGLALSARPDVPPPPPPSPPNHNAFAAEPDNEPRLELRMKPGPSSEAPPRPTGSTSLPGASALNLNRMSASSSASGLAIDQEVAAEAYRVRCHKHGLFYDSRKASGCAKCLERGRKLSAALEARSARFVLAEFDNSIKRAFVGLAIALVVGFIPAAYHAFRIGAGDIHRLRTEQEILSRKPATEEIVQQFEQLNGAVDSATTHATRTTGVVWIVVTGLAMAGWYRVTRET